MGSIQKVVAANPKSPISSVAQQQARHLFRFHPHQLLLLRTTFQVRPGNVVLRLLIFWTETLARVEAVGLVVIRLLLLLLLLLLLRSR